MWNNLHICVYGCEIKTEHKRIKSFMLEYKMSFKMVLRAGYGI